MGSDQVETSLLTGRHRKHHIEHIAASFTVVVTKREFVSVVLEILAGNVNVSAANAALED